LRVVRSLEAEPQEEVPPQILELAERLEVVLNRTHNLGGVLH
jgi:hypothetical protein